MPTAIKIASHTLEFQPTSKNYSKDTFPVGVTRRTLTGALDTHIRAIKRRWVIKVPEQGLLTLLTPFMDGSTVAFEDVDGVSYSVQISGAIPQAGYPAELIGELSITLEEV